MYHGYLFSKLTCDGVYGGELTDSEGDHNDAETFYSGKPVCGVACVGVTRRKLDGGVVNYLR